MIFNSPTKPSDLSTLYPLDTKRPDPSSYPSYSSSQEKIEQIARKLTYKESYKESKKEIPRLEIKYPVSLKEIIVLGKSIKGIEELVFKGELITDEAIKKLIPYLIKNNPSIKVIKIDNTFLSLESIQDLLNSFPKLTEFHCTNFSYKGSFSTRELSEILLPWIKNNPHLQVLNVFYSIDTKKDLEELTTALPTTLKEIQLGISSTADIWDLAFESFTAKVGQSLTHFNFWGEMPDSTFKTLSEQLPKIKGINFNLAGYPSPMIVDVFSKWKDLESLDLSGFYYLEVNDVLNILKNLKNLKAFHLALKTEQMEEIAKTVVAEQGPTLRHLSLSYLDQPQEGLDPVLEALAPMLPQLTHFKVDWLKLSAESLAFLATHLRDLKKIKVIGDYSSTDYPQAHPFMEIIGNCKEMEVIYLQYLSFYSDADENPPLQSYQKVVNLTNLREVAIINCWQFPWVDDPSTGAFVPFYKAIVFNNLNLIYLATNLNLDFIKALKNQVGDRVKTIKIIGKGMDLMCSIND